MSNKQIKVPSIELSAYQRLVNACLNAEGVNTNVLFQVVQSNQAHIIMNRPKRMNAFTFDMYYTLPELIKKANQMEEIKYIVLRGAGNHFSSGNDLVSVKIQGLEDPVLFAKARGTLINNFVQSFILSKKPIFALVQGKCIGFVFVMLPLLDRVFATEDAFFTSPLIRLGLCPEVGSSATFPQIFGQNVSEEILIKGTQVTSKTLQKYGVLTSCKDITEANKLLNVHISELEELEWESYKTARQLMRKDLNKKAKLAVEDEIEILKQRWIAPQIPELVKKQLQREKALKNQIRPKL